MSEPLMVAKGRQGQVELYENKIKIKRKGVLAKLTHWGKGSKEIRLEDITGVQFKEPGIATAGYIQFGQSGYSESDGGLMDASKDENSVTFGKGSTTEFRKLKKKIHDLQEGADKSHEKAEDSAIQRLKERYAEGEISKEEYQEKLEVLTEES